MYKHISIVGMILGYIRQYLIIIIHFVCKLHKALQQSGYRAWRRLVEGETGRRF